jgi:hypothetical protein
MSATTRPNRILLAASGAEFIANPEMLLHEYFHADACRAASSIRVGGPAPDALLAHHRGRGYSRGPRRKLSCAMK